MRENHCTYKHQQLSLPSVFSRILFLIKRHYGVLLLYGQHLAINHLVGQYQIRLVIGGSLLDQSTTDANPQYVQQGTRDSRLPGDR